MYTAWRFEYTFWGYCKDDTKGKILISQMAACHILIVNDPNSPEIFKTYYAEDWPDVTLA